MVQDAYVVPLSLVGVEWEFSISGKVITKQRNRLSPTTIQDLMQTKRWVTHKSLMKNHIQEEEVEDEIIDDEEPFESEKKVYKELAK